MSKPSETNKKKEKGEALKVDYHNLTAKVTWEVASFNNDNSSPNLVAEVIQDRIDFTKVKGDKDVVGAIADIYHYGELTSKL